MWFSNEYNKLRNYPMLILVEKVKIVSILYHLESSIFEELIIINIWINNTDIYI